VSLLDTFGFTALLWVDDDTPLSYQFGFTAPSSNSVLILQTRSEANFGTFLLPAGSGPVSVLRVVAEVFDVFDANSTKSAEVQITAKDMPLNLQLDGLSTALSGISFTVNGMKKLAALSLSLLNSANCSGVSSICQALNRESCQVVSNTCGQCLEGFVVSAGAANTMCLTVSEAEQALRASANLQNANCSIEDTRCPVGNTCSPYNWMCELPVKRCPSDCLGRGECVFIQSTAGFAPMDCSVYDVNCEAACDCYADWFGVDCSLTQEEMTIRQSVKEAVAAKLSTIVGMEIPSVSVVNGWLASLMETAASSDDFTNDSVTSVYMIADYVMDVAPVAGMTPESTASLLSVIDSTASVVSPAGIVGRARRLSGSNVNYTSAVSAATVISRTSSLLSIYGSFATSSMIAGQAALTTVKSTFRLTSQLLSEQSSVSLPSRDLESLTGVAQPSVLSTMNASATAVTVFALSWGLYGNADFLSDPLQIQLSADANICGSDPESGCSFIVVLQNSNPVTYQEPEPVIYVTHCSLVIIVCSCLPSRRNDDSTLQRHSIYCNHEMSTAAAYFCVRCCGWADTCLK
jgi:hypothetical protein